MPQLLHPHPGAAHQSADDFDGALVACIAPRTDQHGQEQRNYKVVF
jgi:hypothetical protein